jgi:hypothetical protein
MIHFQSKRGIDWPDDLERAAIVSTVTVTKHFLFRSYDL